ncbi:hypothetical protein BC2230_10545 [Burkholderia cepacia]
MKNYRTQSFGYDFQVSGGTLSGRMPALFELFVRNAHTSPARLKRLNAGIREFRHR